MGFSSMTTIGKGTVAQSKKYSSKGKGRKKTWVTMASLGESGHPYMPVKLPSFKEAHIKSRVAGLTTRIAALSSTLCADPMLHLVATLAIFKTTLDSPSVVLKDKEQVTKAGGYLAKWLATVAVLVDRSIPTVVSFYNAIPHGERGRWRGLEKTLLFDVIYELAYRVSLTLHRQMKLWLCQKAYRS